MRRRLFLLLGAMLAFTFLNAQSPQISVDPDGITIELASGEDAMKKIAIHNMGGRDLEWKAMAVSEVVEFIKEDGVDWTLPDNQDFITENVILTRGNKNGLFNIAVEEKFNDDNYQSPYGTFWSWGPTQSIPNLMDYGTWLYLTDWNPPDLVGETVSLYCPKDLLFFDITFTSWSVGRDGGMGGFSYIRETPVAWLDIEGAGEGMLIPLEHDSLTLYVDGDMMAVGTYMDEFIIESNDPDMPTIKVPVTLTITGGPEIETDDSDIDFDTVTVNGMAERMLFVENTGSEELVINLSTSTSSFMLADEELVIAPYSWAYTSVEFTPTDLMVYKDTIELSSANPDTTIKIALIGEGVVSPDVEVTPILVEMDTVPGYVLVDSFKVKNTGENTLLFSFKEGPVYFEKPDGADWRRPENQDRITDKVWITKANSNSIFNAAIEEFYQPGMSPENTRWSRSDFPLWAADYFPEEFESQFEDDFKEATDNCPPCMTGNPMYLHLEEKDEYHIVTFDSWSCCGQGGFSYTRQQFDYWFTLSTYEGRLEPGDSMYIVWEVDLQFEVETDLHVDLTLISNSTITPEVDIDIQINLTGTPQIDANDLIEFGDVFIGDTKETTLIISNLGSGFLDIQTMSFDSTVFMVPLIDTTIFPYVEDGADISTLAIPITYSPVGGYFSKDTLRITTNDPDNPVFIIEVEGTGILSPEITFMPDMIDETFAAGTTDTIKIYLENTGGNDLEWGLMSAGDYLEFRKPDNSDWTLEENQDRITDDVWITRQDDDILFNIAQENSASRNVSPTGTMWSSNPTSDSDPSDYGTYWQALGQCCAGDVPGNTYSLYIESSEVYYDVYFDDWSWGANQGEPEFGGFAYTRYIPYDWIMPIDESGIIAAGEKDSVLVVLDGRMLAKGMYEGNLMVFTNVPGNEQIDVPVSIMLEGAPKVGIDVDSIDFDTTFVDGYSMAVVNVTNDSTETLEVMVSNTMEAFGTEESEFMVEPGESYELVVGFMPMDVMTYMDTLVLETNDLGNPMIKIPMDGTGKLPPSIEIMPLAFMDTLFFDSTLVDSILFTNIGDDTLKFNIVDGPDFIPPPAVMGGELIKDDSLYIKFTIDASGMEGGNYMDYVIVESNDPLSPVDSILVELYVNGMFVGEEIADMHKQVGFDSVKIDVSEVFITAQPDPIMITPISSEPGVASVAYMDDTVTVKEVGTGTTIITLMGTDDNGNREFSDFEFRINAPPIVANPLADAIENEGFASSDIDLTDVFADTDDDVLALSATSGTVGVVTVAVAGNTLTVTEVGVGSSEIVVTADDQAGATVTDTMIFRVNAVPVVDAPLADKMMNEGFSSDEIELAAVFTDADGDDLTLSATSGKEGVVTVAVAGTMLTVTEVGTGSSEIVVTADDGVGGNTTDTFVFGVNAIPKEDAPISDMTLSEGFGTSDVDISNVFTDADNDALTYTVASSADAVVTATVSGSTVTLTEKGIGSADITITAKDGNGGEATSDFKVTVEEADALKGIYLSYTIELYPNPSTGEVFLSFADPVDHVLNVRVYDIGGKQVLTETFERVEDKISLDLSGLNDGLFYIRVYDSKEVVFVHEIMLQ